MIDEIALRTENTIQQREAARSLQDAFELNDRILHESPIGQSIYDQSGQCIVANKAIAEMVDAKPKQLLSQNYNTIESWKKCGLYEVARASIATQRNKRYEISFTTSLGKH